MFEGKSAKYGSSFTFRASKYEGQFYTYNTEFLRKRFKAILSELEDYPDQGIIQFQILDAERKAKFPATRDNGERNVAPDAEFQFVVPNKKPKADDAQSF